MAEPTLPQASSAVCRSCRRPIVQVDEAQPITLLYCGACILAKAELAKAMTRKLDQLDTDVLLSVFLSSADLLTRRGIGMKALRHGIDVVASTTPRPFRASVGSPN